MKKSFEPSETNVCVLGLGYIGLPTASVLATKGFSVLGVDVREDVVDTINRGEIHIEEPDLDILVRSAVNSGQLTASTSPQEADVFMICVPTPITPDFQADMSFVEAAARSLRPLVKAGNLVILESTSPPTTTEKLVVPHALPDELTVGTDVFIAHCPERVLPGRILLEVVQNDRVVGGVTPACQQMAEAFYRSFVSGSVLTTSATTAELTKLVENSFRDVNIAFANELSLICDELGVDVWEIIELANRHPRVNILSPGPGVGGHCISVDPWFLVAAAPTTSRLTRMARDVNNDKPAQVVEKVQRLARQLNNPVIGCLGLAYKANVDDLRESPSLEIVRSLIESNIGTVKVCEPFVSSKQFDEFPLHTLDEVIEQAQLIVLLTDHDQFRALPARTLIEKIVVDTRGIWR